MKQEASFYSWEGLFYLVLILFTAYWLIKLVGVVTHSWMRKGRLKRQVELLFERALLLYKPLAFSVVLLAFIAINYIVHGIFILVFLVIGLPSLRNYLSGLQLKFNGLLRKGAIIETLDLSGEIAKLLPLGIVINSAKGESYVDYASLSKHQYTLVAKDDAVLRQTLLISTERSNSDVLDLLFVNPMLDFLNKPTIVNSPSDEHKRLQFTLEDGVRPEDFIAFLTEQNITVAITENLEK